MSKLIYFSKNSPYEGDITKNDTLCKDEIDNNFYELKGDDINRIEFDKETKILSLIRNKDDFRYDPNPLRIKIDIEGGSDTNTGGGSTSGTNIKTFETLLDAEIYAESEEAQVGELVIVVTSSEVFLYQINHDKQVQLITSTNGTDFPADDYYTKTEIDYKLNNLPPQINLEEISGEGLFYFDNKINVDTDMFYVNEDFFVKGVNVGNLTDGTKISKGTSLDTILKMMLQKRVPPTYIQPTLTSNITNTSSEEVGVVLDIDITPIWNKNDAGQPTNYMVQKNGNIIFTQTTPIAYTDYGIQLTDTQTQYIMRVDYGQGAIKNDNFNNPDSNGRIEVGYKTTTQNVKGYRQAFYKTSKSDININTSDDIRTEAFKLNNPLNNSKFTININQGDKSIVIAYPDYLNNITSIQQETLSNADIKGSFTLTKVDVAGFNSYSPIKYKVYKYTALVGFNADKLYVTI